MIEGFMKGTVDRARLYRGIFQISSSNYKFYQEGRQFSWKGGRLINYTSSDYFLFKRKR
jgi:hypothetical protein